MRAMADGTDQIESRVEAYRKQAKACLEVAERMSIDSDRARMLQMAQHWLGLAIKAEREASLSGPGIVAVLAVTPTARTTTSGTRRDRAFPCRTTEG